MVNECKEACREGAFSLFYADEALFRLPFPEATHSVESSVYAAVGDRS